MAVAGIALAVAAGDEVDRHHVGDDADIGMRGRRFLQRLLHRPAGGVVDMDDAAVAVPALAGEVPAILALSGVERHAELGQPRDRSGCVANDELDGGAVVEAGAGHHRVLDVALERVAGLQHRRDTALRPPGRALALGKHRHLEAVGEIQRRSEARGAGSDNDDVELLLGHQAGLKFVLLRKQEPSSFGRWSWAPASAGAQGAGSTIQV